MPTVGLNDFEGHSQPKVYESVISLQLRMKDPHLHEIWFCFVNVLHMNISKETTANAAMRHCTLPLHREYSCLAATARIYFYSVNQIALYCSLQVSTDRCLIKMGGGFFCHFAGGCTHNPCKLWGLGGGLFLHLLSQQPCTIMAGMGIFLL